MAFQKRFEKFTTMKKNLLVFLSVLLLIVASKPADDVLTELGLTQAQARQQMISAYKYGLNSISLWSLSADKRQMIESVSPAKRAELVRGILTLAKSFFMSDDFQSAYAESEGLHKPTPPQSRGSVSAEQQKKQMDMAEQSMQYLPESVKAQYKQQLEQAKKQIVADSAKNAVEDTKSQARYQADLKTYNESSSKYTLSKPQLKTCLKEFLETTKDIDFDAKLISLPNGKKRFLDPRLESRPAFWKYCFRAGKEPVEAARSIAQTWLKELDGK
jgi:hypothetical protein